MTIEPGQSRTALSPGAAIAHTQPAPDLHDGLVALFDRLERPSSAATHGQTARERASPR